MINAKAICKRFNERGMELVRKDTTNHLVLVDLRNKGVNGREVEDLLGSINITLNKNSIPNDPESPFVTSGIRIGTPAITTRGFKEQQSKQVADLICDAIENKDNESKLSEIKNTVKSMCSKFPVYS